MISNEKDGDVEVFSSYSSRTVNNFWNLLFYNTQTGQINILDENRRMVITSMEYKVHPPATIGVIFYEIKVADYNKDGLLDHKDPTYLFVSNHDGTTFRQLSPNEINLTHWQLLAKSSLVLMQGTRNSNNDKKFDEEDETVVYQFDLNKNTVPAETFSKDLVERLKLTLWKHWGQQKKG